MECELVKSKKRFWTKNEKTHGNNQHWINIRTKQYKTRGNIYVYNCIYIYICSRLISPCCSTCWSAFLRFSISSPGDFISLPHLLDHLIKGVDQFSKPIWSIYQKNMFPTYLFILSFGFISCPKFSQFISPVHHYSFSSVLQSVPNLLVHVIIGFHQFFPLFSWVYHDVWWVLVVRSFIVSLDVINFFHQSLHCTIHFHQFSPTYLWFLSLVTRCCPFSPTTC